VKVFGAPGAGGRCAACNLDLLKNQLVMDVPLTDDGPPLQLHGDCFMIWDAQRTMM
jgi:hypothetical protein